MLDSIYFGIHLKFAKVSRVPILSIRHQSVQNVFSLRFQDDNADFAHH